MTLNFHLTGVFRYLLQKKNDLDLLHKHFVISSVDKAANNFSFTCKKYYIDNMNNELNSTDTYVLSDQSHVDLVKSRVLF